MSNARTIATALGGHATGKNTILCPGPGHSPRDRSLAVRIDPNAPDGFLVFSHAGDDWRECRDCVRQRLRLPAWEPGDGQQRRVPHQHVPKWDLAAVESEMEDIPSPWTEDELARIAGAQELWNESVNPRGTLAERYLREWRGLELTDELAGTALRFHAKCPWRDENTCDTVHVPALVVPFRSIDDDAITGIHRIALNPDGSKLDRRMLGITGRAAVKLDAVADELVIGEGVETTLAARQLGFKPAWALGSVGAISFFPIIDCVKRLVILGEAGEVSAKAIKICGKRWHGKARRRVRIVMPNEGFSDLNDVLIAQRTGS